MTEQTHQMRNAVEMPKSAVLLHGLAARAIRMIPTIGEKLMNAGDVANYVQWQSSAFPQPVELLWKREALWEKMADRIDRSRPLFVLEFGVAWGYATEHWLQLLAGRDVEWHGFDRFTGMPRGWRDYPEGAFDTAGKLPAIDDDRITWHVGDVEDTLHEIDLEAAREAQWLVLFDLDIYEPTAAAWQVVGPMLRPGDLLYFDEAMDADERRVLNEMVIPERSVVPIGTTSLGLAVEVTG